MNKKLLTIPTLILAGTLAAGFSTKTFADSITGSLGVGVNTTGTSMQVNGSTSAGFSGGSGQMQHMPGVFGTVTAVNGNTITLQSKGFGQNATSTTYTVDASSATVDKDRAASSISNIAVGDNLMVQGTVSGTSVAATTIHDSLVLNGGAHTGTGTSTMPEGNGQPVIGGKVTAVSGNTITITNSSNVSYTIDVSNAKITKAGTTSTTSNIAIGDEVLAQGTINGNSVTAVSLIDSASISGTSSTTTAHVGIFGKIGGFFSHLFGF